MFKYFRQRFFIALIFMLLPFVLLLAMLQTPTLSQFLLSASLRSIRFKSGIKIDATDWKINPLSFSAIVENPQVGYEQLLISSRRLVVQVSPIGLFLGKVQILEVSLQGAWARGRLSDRWFNSDEPLEYEYKKTDLPVFASKKLSQIFKKLKEKNLDVSRVTVEGVRSDLTQIRFREGHILFEKLADDQAIADFTFKELKVPSEGISTSEVGASLSLTKDFKGNSKLGIQNFRVQENNTLELSVSGNIPGQVRIGSKGQLTLLNEWLGNWRLLEEKVLSTSVTGAFESEVVLEWNTKQAFSAKSNWKSTGLEIDGFEPGQLDFDIESRSENLDQWAIKNLNLVIPHQILGGPKSRKPKNQFFADEILINSNLEVSGRLRVQDVELCDVLYATYVDECFQSLYTDGILRFDGKLDPFVLQVYPQLRTSAVEVRSESFHLNLDNSHLLTANPAYIKKGVVEVRATDLLLKRVEVSFDGQPQPAIVDGRIRYVPSEVQLDVEANRFKLDSALKEFLGLQFQGEGNISSRIEFYSKTKQRNKVIRVNNQVDFPAFSLMNQLIGEVKGPVTFSNQRLQIGPLKVKQGGGLATVHGSVVRRPNQKPSLNFDGKLQRVEMKTFAPDAKAPFFRGFVSGSFQFRTDLQDDLTGPILAQIDNFQAFGLPFQTATLEARYKEGKLYVDDLKARRGNSLVHLNGILNPDGGTELKFRTDEFPIADIELDSSFKYFSKGSIKLNGAWKPSLGWNLVGSAFQMELAGREIPQTEFRAEGNDSRIQVFAEAPDFLKLDYEGVYDKTSIQPQSIELKLKDGGIYSGMAYLKKWKTGQPVQTKGELSLLWKPNKGNFQMKQLSIRGPVGLQNASEELLSVPKSFECSWSGSNLDYVRGEINGASLLQARSSQDSKALLLNGQLPMPLVGLFVPNVQIYNGSASMNAEVPMPPDVQTLKGSVTVKEGVVGIRGIGQNITELGGNISVESGVAELSQIEGRLGTGHVHMSGTYKLSLSRPATNLKIRLDRSRLVIMDDLPVVASGDLTLAGENFPYKLSGQISVLESLYSREFEMQENFSTTKLEEPSLEFQINADMSSETQIRNSTLQGKLSGRLEILGNDQDAYVVGRLEFLTGGKLIANQHEFEITQGLVDFPQEGRVPLINLQGTTKIKTDQEVRVDLTALGPADQLNLQFTSDPPMPTNEIVQLLAFGYVSKESRGAETDALLNSSNNNAANSKDSSLWAQEGSVEALQALFGKAIGGRLQQSTGFDVGVKGQRSALNANEASGGGAKIVVGKKLNERLSATFGQSLETTLPQQDVKVDYRLFNNVNLSGVWENKTENNVQDTSVGVDLRFRFEFK